MSNTHKKANKNGKAVAVGVAGAAVVAAGVAVAALSKKENRKKAGKILKKVKKEGKAFGIQAIAEIEKVQKLHAKIDTPSKIGSKKITGSKKRSISTSRKSSSRLRGDQSHLMNSKMAN
ncbi:MAG TPA: hypothetical protein VLG67_03040 [Candidatus Saccharimonadales bacterium]|nr:hypothetical protein [Candidatus Saccharimonadales bacterium]